jgi:hypothetical protein
VRQPHALPATPVRHILSVGTSTDTRIGVKRSMAEGEDSDSFWAPLKWPARATLVLVAHIALAALLVTGIWALERYANWLYGEKMPLLYGKIPLAWAFDTMDLGVLSLFIFWGLVEANRNLKRR